MSAPSTGLSRFETWCAYMGINPLGPTAAVAVGVDPP